MYLLLPDSPECKSFTLYKDKYVVAKFEQTNGGYTKCSNPLVLQDKEAMRHCSLVFTRLESRPGIKVAVLRTESGECLYDRFIILNEEHRLVPVQGEHCVLLDMNSVYRSNRANPQHLCDVLADAYMRAVVDGLFTDKITEFLIANVKEDILAILPMLNLEHFGRYVESKEDRTINVAIPDPEMSVFSTMCNLILDKIKRTKLIVEKYIR